MDKVTTSSFTCRKQLSDDRRKGVIKLSDDVLV